MWAGLRMVSVSDRMPLSLIFRAKIAQKRRFVQFLAIFEQKAAYTLLCMASKMDRMQLFIIFQGNNCTKTPIYAIIGLILSKQLHMRPAKTSCPRHQVKRPLQLVNLPQSPSLTPIKMAFATS